MDYAFHTYNSMSGIGLSEVLTRFIGEIDVPPVIVCIGSDLAIGDSLGPITGTLIYRKFNNFPAYIYGTLRSPVTAKEIKYITKFLRQTHPNSKIIAIDAAVGEDSDIGLIKISDGPLRPGSGANKRLHAIGDVSILGIIAKKSTFCYSQLNLTRLNTVYMMAEIISEAVGTFLSNQIQLLNEPAV